MNDGTKVIDDLISVVVPVYNVEKYVGQCIESIINQTYKNLEIILVDDGSTDNSGKICDEYAKKDNRIKVIHKENGGLVTAKKVGINVATGQYVSIIDSDDSIKYDMYTKMLKIMKEYNVDFVDSGFERDNGYKIFPANKNCYIKYYDAIPYVKSIITYIPVSGVKIIKSDCTKLLLCDKYRKCYNNLPDNCWIGEDEVTLCEYVLNSKSFYAMNEIFYNYRIRSDSNTEVYNFNRINGVVNRQKRLFDIIKEYHVEDKLKDIIEDYGYNNIKYIIQRINTDKQKLKEKENKNIMKNTGWYHCFPFGSVEKNSNIAIYGMGEIGRHYLKQLEETGYCKVECASDGNWQNISDVNVKMVSPEELAKMDLTVIIANGNADVANQIINRLKELGMSEERIIWEDYNIMDEVETDIYTKKQQGNVTRYNGKYHLFPFEKIEKNEKIIIWGMGAVGESYNLQVNQTGYCDIAYDVYADWDKIKDHKVVIASDDYHEAQRLIKQFKDWGVEEKNIIWNDHLVSEMMVINVKIAPQAPKKEAPAPATPRQTVQNNKPKVKLIIPKAELANVVKLLMNEGNREIEIECK